MTPAFTAPERLTLLLSLARPDAAESTEIRALAEAGDLDWAEVASLCTHNQIRPWAQKQLTALGLWARVPEASAAPWAAFTEKIARANEARLAIATPLFTEAADAGIRIALLKGIYFAERYYGDPTYKKMNDIDFLMPVESLEPLYKLYESHDFFSLGLLLDDDKQTKFSHHAPPFFHRSLGCVLGTHWGLVSPLTKYRPDYAAMWDRAVPFEFLGRRHWALAPEDNLHHLAIHLPYYKTGLRELADLYNLLRAERAFDWALFEREVEKAHSEDLVYHALSLVQALFPSPAVESCLQRLAPRAEGFYARDARHRVREPRRILYARSTHMSEIDKAFGEFTMSDDLKTKLRAYWGMWGNGLLAPRAEVARFHYVDADAWHVPLLYPSMFGRVLRYIAKDLGWKIFALVVVKHQLDLWKCAGRALIRRTRPDKLQEAARRNGIGPEQILQLRSLLE